MLNSVISYQLSLSVIVSSAVLIVIIQFCVTRYQLSVIILIIVIVIGYYLSSLFTVH
ncbi:MAG UNVERIFIED_CONTAM: hypothetical protein LVR29_26355 [Microcystis novacekii LVE1205-3]